MDQVVPLTNAPNQTMAVALAINDTVLNLQLTLRFNDIIDYWVMDVSDSNNNSIVADIPLITGVWPSGNILGQYQYLEIGSAYVLDVSNDLSRDYPTDVDLGTDFVLLWSDNV